MILVNPPDTFDDVQRIVLMGTSGKEKLSAEAGTPWEFAQYVVLGFPRDASPEPEPLRFLNQLLKLCPVTPASSRREDVQVSLGFSRRGLEALLRIQDPVLACFTARAPAFTAGAAARAASHAGNHGLNGPQFWDSRFAFARVDAVVSVHALKKNVLEKAVRDIEAFARATHVNATRLVLLDRLRATAGEQIVHFGFRDGLSRVGIKGWRSDAALQPCKPVSIHPAGEFLLGHPQRSGARSWIRTAGQPDWSPQLRSFFRNGSFGVLHQVEQDVGAFEDFVATVATQTKLPPDDVKARLCGRTLAGVPLATSALEGPVHPLADFDYADDGQGTGCPFGSHVRRMNPRGGFVAHDEPRPLLRRGMPYGAEWTAGEDEGDGMGLSGGPSRGLFGHFFCASIEDQYEHLLAHWADCVPLGSPDGGDARDPLIGAHERGDGDFEIPFGDQQAYRLPIDRPFTRTRGIAYLFYPSVSTLQRIADNDLFRDHREDHE